MKTYIQSSAVIVKLSVFLMGSAIPAWAQTGQTVIWNDGGLDMTWTQPDANNWSGATYTNGDFCQFTNPGAGVITISNIVTPGAVLVSGTNNYAFTGGAISGTGTFTVSGSNVVTFLNTNTYTGLTEVTGGGVLNVGAISNNAVSPGSGLLLGDTNAPDGIYGILEGNGAFLCALSGTNTPGPNQVQCAAGGFAARGGTLTVNLGGAGAPIALSQGGFAFGNNFVFGSSEADSQVILVNPINLNGSSNLSRIFTVNPGVGGDSAELEGPVSDSSTPPNKLEKAGNGLLILAATNTYTGATMVNSGTVQLTGALAPDSSLIIGNLTNSGAFILGGAGGAVNQTVAGLASTGTGAANTVVGGAATVSTLTVNLAGTNTFIGSLGGAGTNENNLALVMSGNGELILSGANTYAGTTTVNAGELLLNGSLADGSAVTVNTSGTLGGDGTVDGSVQVNAGGVIAPGSGTNGTLTVSNLTLTSGASVVCWLNPSNDAAASSCLAVLGAQSVTNATLTVANVGPALYGGYTFRLFSNTNGVAGFTAINLPSLPAGYAWITNLAVNGTLQLLPPPPQTLYVSPAGSDTNSGTFTAPLHTLAAATSLLGPGDTLYLLAGIYRETLQPTNSGVPGYPITIAAYPGAAVTISACDLATNGWTPAANGFVTNGIYSTSVGTNLGEGYNQIFMNGVMQHEAQFPNWTATNSLLNPPTLSVLVSGHTAAVNPNTISNAVFGTLPANFFAGGVFAGGVGQCYGWQTALITNSSGNFLTVDPTTESFGWCPDYVGQTTNTGIGFVYGLTNLLDADGEWFLQTNAAGAGALFLRVNNGTAPGTNVVELKSRNWCVNLTNCNYISVSNLSTSGGAIQLSGTGDVLADVNAGFMSHYLSSTNYSIQNGGRTEGGGVVLAGSSNTVSGCILHDTAGCGVCVSGHGHLITGNLISNIDYSATYAASVALLTSSANITVTFNTLINCGRNLVTPLGTGHAILYNDLSGMGWLTMDLGGVYTGEGNGQATGGGLARIAYNWVHDGYAQVDHKIQGIYFDNYSRNYIVDHNVCWNIGDPEAYDILLNSPGDGRYLYHNTLFTSNPYDNHSDCVYTNGAGNPATNYWTTNNVHLFFTAQNNLVLSNLTLMNSNLADTNVADEDFRLLTNSPNVNPPLTTGTNVWVATSKKTVPAWFSLSGTQPTGTQPFSFSETNGQGVVISNINCGFVGATPDNGAYESGVPYWKPGIAGFVSGDPGIVVLPAVPAVTSLTLKAMVLSLGMTNAASANVLVFWGTADGGTNAAAWANQATVTNGLATNFVTLSYVVTNLTPSQTYVCRFCLTNSQGQAAWSAAGAATTLAPSFVTWNDDGLDMTWAQPDSANWSAPGYNSGDFCLFTNLGAGTITISGTVTPGSVTVNSTSNYVFSGGSIGGPGTFTVSGSNIVTFLNANTYAGLTEVTGSGVLNVGTISNNSVSLSNGLLLGDATATDGFYGVLEGNGTFTCALGGNATPGPNQVGGAAGGFAAEGGTLTVNLGGAGAPIALNQAGFTFGNNFVFGANNADSQVIVVNPVNLNSSSSRVFTVNPGVGGDSAVLQGLIFNTNTVTGNALEKRGNGTLVLTATNTYPGITAIFAGTLQLGNGGSSGSLNTNGAISLTGTLAFSRTNTITQGADFSSSSISGAGGLQLITNGILALTTTNTYTGRTMVTGGGVMDVGTISNNFVSSGSGLLLGDATATDGIYGILEGNGVFTRALSATGTPGANQVAGAAGGFAARGGTLTVNFGGAEAAIALNQAGFIFGNNFVFGSSLADSQVIVVNPINLNSSSARIFTVNPGVGGDETVLQGVIFNTNTASGYAFEKKGDGTLVLAAANTYPGTTVVSNGTLLVNGAIGGAVLVATNATLGGTGAIGGVVTVNSGGTLAPGAGTTLGTLTINSNLTLNSGAAACFGLNTTNTPMTNDFLVVSRTLSVSGGTLTVSNLGPALVAGDKFILLSKTTGGFTTFNLPPGYTWTNRLAVDGSIQVLTVSNPPDPLVLGAGGNPVNLGWKVTGNTVAFGWPANYLGWILQVQTNGLKANGWLDVPGSAGVISTNFAIDPGNPSVFYRLRHP